MNVFAVLVLLLCGELCSRVNRILLLNVLCDGRWVLRNCWLHSINGEPVSCMCTVSVISFIFLSDLLPVLIMTSSVFK